MPALISSTDYKGRFAPSPTGAVHFGTLVAAVASYLQAKKNNGEWLIRMEDVDTTRKVEGSDKNILNTLEAFGFEWHGEVLYQSAQTEHYEIALAELMQQSLVFPCTCSRKLLSETGSEIYPGTCRTHKLPEKKPHALRLLAKNTDIHFIDRVMGKQSQKIKQQCGDFVIKRRDGLFAYQLAVVVDDALQGITEIVRGTDLLDSTACQIYLQQQLNYATPNYCHLPLAVDKHHNKISKSEGAAKVNHKNREQWLYKALNFLGQNPPSELINTDIDSIWQWAIRNWKISNVPAKDHQPMPI